MGNLPFRQVHLDFHTSGKIAGIGEKFDPEQFIGALKEGHVNSITVFSKCHHGYSYHPTKVNQMHPHLKFDLLKAQIDACHKAGIRAPIYISAGLDEKEALQHPEWLLRTKDSGTKWVNGFMEQAGYHTMCYNTGYMELLLEQTEEVLQNYPVDELFFDISSVRPCYCTTCISQMLAEGSDPRDDKAALALAERVYENYTRRLRALTDKYEKNIPIFHNGGHIVRGRRDLAHMNNHLELESLPTGGWGYDHFPMSVSYVRTLGLEYLGMTGKFHTTWGEFGGFKHPNALRYEAALSIAWGAKCSIGDQLHPSGLADMATYHLIGAAYSEVEQKEAWCDDVTPVVDVAVLSSESTAEFVNHFGSEAGLADEGACRILLEGKYLFNLIDTQEDFDQYKIIILPDTVTLHDALKKKLDRYLADGGKLLASGKSGLNSDKTDFAFDFKAKYLGENQFVPDYLRPAEPLKNNPEATFVMYSQGYRMESNGAQVLAYRENPYFNRDILHFCSHQHTPSTLETAGCGAVITENTAYIGWEIFSEYAKMGSLHLKELVCATIDRLLCCHKSLGTNLPAQGVVTLMDQKDASRLVNHLLYASPVKRGRGIEVIEDMVPLRHVKVDIKTDTEPKRVYLAPQGQDIPYLYQDGRVHYTVEEFACHQMVVIDY